MKILPPVIENLLQKSKLTAEYFELGGQRVDGLKESVQAVEEYKKQFEKEKNLISLFVVSDESERIEIKIPRIYIQANAAPNTKNAHDFLRKEVKELFSDACSTLFEAGIESVYFEDEREIQLEPTRTYRIQWRWRGDKEMEWCNFPSKQKMSKSEAEKFIKDYNKAFNLPLIFRTKRI